MLSQAQLYAIIRELSSDMPLLVIAVTISNLSLLLEQPSRDIAPTDVDQLFQCLHRARV